MRGTSYAYMLAIVAIIFPTVIDTAMKAIAAERIFLGSIDVCTV